MEGLLVPWTETPALVEPIDEAEIQRAIEIVQAHRMATSQLAVVGPHTKAVIIEALVNGHSQHFILETFNKTYEEMQGAKSSAIPNVR